MTENVLERFRELPPNLANHLMITVIALGVGVLVSVPTAIGLSKVKSLRYPVLTIAGIVQTIPSLALLALMVPVLAVLAVAIDPIYQAITGESFQAFGFWPAVIALTLYSILPILRNTVTGIVGVDPAMTEAARGMGMTERQMLWQVELPLAAPVIIAGIRTATVWVVGIATLATPVGQRCLGNFIFTGLQTRNWTMVMFGVVSAAVLAILLDLLIGGLEKAAAERRRTLGAMSIVGLGIIVIGGLISPSLVQWARAGDGGPTLRVGAKTFTEQYILAELVSDRLEAAGFNARTASSLGSTIIFDALAAGDLDVYVDYSGTIWANYMKREETADPQTVLQQMTDWLAAEHGIRCLGNLGFENAYALAMRRDQAEALGITSIADLARHAPEMKIGGDYEFFGRPEWEAIRDSYGLNFTDTISYDSSIMYQAVAQGQVDVIAAFSSDGRIAAFDLVVLEDPRNVIPPYDAVLLLGPTVADDAEVIAALEPLVGAVPVDLMRRANYMVDRDEDKRTVNQAASWLAEQIDTSASP